MNLETLERICFEHDRLIEDLEKEILTIIKINKNLEIQLEELDRDEHLTLAWVSAYPKD